MVTIPKWVVYDIVLPTLMCVKQCHKPPTYVDALCRQFLTIFGMVDYNDNICGIIYGKSKLDNNKENI